MIKKILVALPLLFINCEGFIYKEHVIDKYYLCALELRNGMSLSYSVDENADSFVGVVNPVVFALGFNREFIIIKQHPEKSAYEPDKSTTNYFIIPLLNKVSKSYEKNVIGPMTKMEFEIKRDEIGVENDLNFTKIFEDLE